MLATSDDHRQLDIETDALGHHLGNVAAVGGIAADRLRRLVERIERLREERKTLAGEFKDIFAEAKSAGFDVNVLRQRLRLRTQDPAEVEHAETLLHTYRRALGI